MRSLRLNDGRDARASIPGHHATGNKVLMSFPAIIDETPLGFTGCLQTLA